MSWAALVDGATLWTSVIFFSALGCVVGSNGGSLFLRRRYGHKHAYTGLLYLSVLTASFLDGIAVIPLPNEPSRVAADVALGALGILLTLTAAADFKHHGVKNVASGTLDKHATVTHGEMIEHSFYQLLNLVQIVYLHVQGMVSSAPGAWERAALLICVTLPWVVRSRFPVNHFSDNYNRLDPKSTALVRLMYRIKKYQYVFYKGFLLHGLNITVALASHTAIAHTPLFRMYWVLLNAAYVMEFFLQTLVKKSYLRQDLMLGLNGVLMAASTGAALRALQVVYPTLVSLVAPLLCVASNLTSRGHDLRNTLLIWALMLWLDGMPVARS